MDWQKLRTQMVKEQLVARGIRDERVLSVMSKVPREMFVPDSIRESAYYDGPLSIGEGQTISQPYMVALMTECLQPGCHEKVLELGTGSGYQTAILAELVNEVYSIERIDILSQRGAIVLEKLGYHNVHLKVGDGTYGWPEVGPFDGIIVTASAPEISQILVDQLKEGGRMVVPVGSHYSQMLYRVTKKPSEQIDIEEFSPCVFVPLIGDFGWKEN